MTYKNPYFFMTTEPIGWVFCQVADSYIYFLILKHIQTNSQFWKLLMMKESDGNIFGTNGTWVCVCVCVCLCVCVCVCVHCFVNFLQHFSCLDIIVKAFGAVKRPFAHGLYNSDIADLVLVSLKLIHDPSAVLPNDFNSYFTAWLYRYWAFS